MSSNNTVSVAVCNSSPEDLDEVYSDWSSAVNMSASQLRRWSKNPCSREASVKPVAVIKRNLRLLEKNKSDWDSNDVSDAKRTISFIERMSSDDNKPESPLDGSKGCPTSWAISLLNWAYNPFDSIPGVPDDVDTVDEVSLEDKTSSMITAYHIEPSTEELEAEEGDMVRIDEGAYDDAGLNELEMDEPTDDEYDYERLGFVIDKHTDDFNWANAEGDGGQTVTVEDGREVYIVGLAHTNGGSHPFYADQISTVDRDEILGDMDIDADPADMGDEEDGEDEEENSEPELDISGSSTVEELTPVNSPVTSRGNAGPPWPESWKKSNKPARLIALDAWQSMGASFRGCRRSMVKSMSNPNRYCARFKDTIYGHTYWRN